MTNIIILIILVPTALLLAIIFVGKQFRKMDVKDEQIHEAELKYLQDRAKELKELGLINSVYDFLTGANEQRNRQKEKGV